MAEEKRNLLGPYIPQGNMLKELFQQLKLAYHLMIDPRVHPLAKLIPIAALTYLVLPTDLVPDLALGVGQLDDLAVLMVGLRLFLEVSPPAVVREYLRRLTQGGHWEDAEPSDQAPKPAPDDDVVDGTYEVKDP